ncbi:hypothetical protein PISL3812_08561 [Talaromyces islandicus]|uniref:Uncharacterized protein n=1 Tax=Talaromyces islandicus TaxID=28573 RepID=A0A0U1M826_TALIS|nr:hypothetical protein PISL3812_08561 [Talaromyces islandicus]
MEQVPRPRRFSFSLRQQKQQDDPPKAEPLEVTTIGYPIDALPLYIEKTQPTSMERREICVSPTWKKKAPKSRGRSQSVPPIMGEGRQTSRRLVKKQPPAKQQQRSRRESTASSGNNNNDDNDKDNDNAPRFGLISSISTRIRSRRPSISRNATTDGYLPALHGPRQSDELNAIPAPRMSATLPPGFGATITRDLRQAPGPVLAAPHPRGQDREAGQINGYAEGYSGLDTGPRLRRAGAHINNPLSDEVNHGNIITNGAHLDTPNTRPIKKHSERKDITIPDSLRIGGSKKIEPGPKSPKRARPKGPNNPPNYSLPKQKQEQTHHTCKDCQQNISRAAENRESQNITQNTGNQNETDISTPTSPQNPIATSPKPRKASWPLSSKTNPEKEETTGKPDESKKESVSTPNTTKRLSPLQLPTTSRDSTTNDSSASSTLVADSPALSTPPVADALPKTTNQEKSGPASTDSSSSARNSATTSAISPISPISPRSPAAVAQAKEKVPRNTMTPRQDKYLAKIFVVCCQCNFWHDIPSALYAKMIIPEQLLFTEQRPESGAEKRLSGQKRDSAAKNQPVSSPRNSPETTPDNTVQCCWCSHPMAKACCTGWTTMVHLLEKHH